MKRTALFVALIGAVILIGSQGIVGQEKKPKAKGQLPSGWTKLNLTVAQKEEVYKVQAKYRAEKAELNKKLKELSTKEREEMVAVLTDEQKEELKRITLGEKKPTKKPTDKKPTDKKPTEEKK